MGNPFGRNVIIPLTNQSGGGVIAGDFVYLDTAHNDSFTTGTTAAYTGGIGIAQQTIGSGSVGLVLVSGYAALVNVNASVTRGDYVSGFTVAKQATDGGAARGPGTCGFFLTGGTTPDAMIWQPDLGGAGVSVTTKGDLQGYTTVAARVGVGPNGSILVADSSKTPGLGWRGADPAQLLFPAAVSATPITGTWSPAPASTSTLYACIATVISARAVSAITQTNVTWTLVRALVNGTTSSVELWKGVPSGAPGTSVSVALAAGATNAVMSLMEWPTGTGLAHTLDQHVDTTSSATHQESGMILPTADNLAFFLAAGGGGGAIILQASGPFYAFLSPGTTGFAWFGYLFGGKNPLRAGIPTQTTGASANMILDII